MDRKVIRSVVWDYIIITVGALLYVVAWTSFLIPNGIASGGLTGACTIIEMATRGLIPVGWSFPALNALLIILATLILGTGFGFRPIYAILVAMIINKCWPVSPGQVYLYFDLFIIASVLLIPGKTFQDMMYGYLAMISFSLVVDYVLLGRKSSVQVLIFSEKFTDIADFIIHEMDRGVTAINAVGWYTQSEKKVLLVLARKSQLHEITKAVKGVDPKAFMSVSPASDVYGEGFEEIKTGIDRKKKA